MNDKLIIMHNPSAPIVDREAPICEVPREGRDLHLVVVDKKPRGTKVLGRLRRTRGQKRGGWRPEGSELGPSKCCFWRPQGALFT